jgi:PPOX class probable F420-dependent enzyme
MRAFVMKARVGRLATVDPDGYPHLVPVCYALLDDLVVSAVDHKPKRGRQLRRLANIRATGRASLLVDEYSEDWSALRWVRIDGPARVADDPAESRRAVAALVAKYQQYREQPPDGPVVVLQARRWTGWAASG